MEPTIDATTATAITIEDPVANDSVSEAPRSDAYYAALLEEPADPYDVDAVISQRNTRSSPWNPSQSESGAGLGR